MIRCFYSIFYSFELDEAKIPDAKGQASTASHDETKRNPVKSYQTWCKSRKFGKTLNDCCILRSAICLGPGITVTRTNNPTGEGGEGYQQWK